MKLTSKRAQLCKTQPTTEDEKTLSKCTKKHDHWELRNKFKSMVMKNRQIREKWKKFFSFDWRNSKEFLWVSKKIAVLLLLLLFLLFELAILQLVVSKKAARTRQRIIMWTANIFFLPFRHHFSRRLAS